MPVIGPIVDTSPPASALANSWPGVPGTDPTSVAPNQYNPGAPYRSMRIAVGVGTAELRVWAVPWNLAGGGTQVIVWQDNVYMTTLNYSGTKGVKAMQTLALDGAAHTIQLEELAVVTNVTLASGAPVTWVPASAPDVGVLYYGDSVVFGTNAAPLRNSHFDVSRHALPATYGTTNFGVSGKGMSASGPADVPVCLARLYGTTKNICVCNLGVNDYNPGGAVANYIASYQTWINGMLAGSAAWLLLVTLPNALFTPVGGGSPFGANLNGSTGMDYVNAVVSLGTSNGPRVKLLNLFSPGVYPSSVVPSTWTADGVHPENAGMALIAPLVTAAILAI
jgi:lysophospholipase L1-like esterase